MSNTDQHVFNVPDMSCQHCVDAITKEVGAVAGVESLDIDLESKLVTIVGGDSAALVDAIDEAGFDIASA